MPLRLPTIALLAHPDEASVYADGDIGGWTIAESPSQYRPGHPERSAFYQLFETHLDRYIRAYEVRFEPRSGPLRPVVVRSVEEFLSCGRLQGGFARIRCDKCRKEHLLAYSCRTRNFCSSCQAKRSVLFAEKLTGEILAPAADRPWTFSIPRVLRGLFERERSLLSLLSQTAYASILRTFQALLSRKNIRPGCVLSLQTYGAYGANFNPHCHGLVTEGAFSNDGEYLPLPSLDASAVCQLFRRLLLLRLHQAERLSESFMQNLLSWIHPGFSVFAGPPVEAAAVASLESHARYITGPVLAPLLQMMRLKSVQTAAWLWKCGITSHVPDPGRHCQRFYEAYSNRGRIPVAIPEDDNAASPRAKHCEQDNSDGSREASSTWARLIKKIFEADPLLCPCGGRMRIVSFITDPRVVDRILRIAKASAVKHRKPGTLNGFEH
jgi:hypothetical protein